MENDKEMSKIVFTKADGSGILARILTSVRNHFPMEDQIELNKKALNHENENEDFSNQCTSTENGFCKMYGLLSNILLNPTPPEIS